MSLANVRDIFIQISVMNGIPNAVVDSHRRTKSCMGAASTQQAAAGSLAVRPARLPMHGDCLPKSKFVGDVPSSFSSVQLFIPLYACTKG
jgi:hypothetical protein